MAEKVRPKRSNRERRWRRKIKHGFSVCLLQHLTLVLEAWERNGISDRCRPVFEAAKQTAERIKEESSRPLVIPQISDPPSKKKRTTESRYAKACRNALSCVLTEAQKSHPGDAASALRLIVSVWQEVCEMQKDVHERFMETAVERAKSKIA